MLSTKDLLRGIFFFKAAGLFRVFGYGAALLSWPTLTGQIEYFASGHGALMRDIFQWMIIVVGVVDILGTAVAELLAAFVSALAKRKS